MKSVIVLIIILFVNNSVATNKRKGGWMMSDRLQRVSHESDLIKLKLYHFDICKSRVNQDAGIFCAKVL